MKAAANDDEERTKAERDAAVKASAEAFRKLVSDAFRMFEPLPEKKPRRVK